MVSDSSAGKYSKYVYGNGLIASYETEDATYKTMSGQGARAILKGETTEYRTYLYDLRGSVVKATNESGKTVAEYSYSTYGKRETVSGDQYSPLGYCARDGVLTEENGLLYMRARYYSTELMRFINQDIVVGDISNSSSLNRYTYVEGNPATLIDPFGLDAKRSIKRVEPVKYSQPVVGMANAARVAGTCVDYYANALQYYKSRYSNSIENQKALLEIKKKETVEKLGELPDYTEMMNDWMDNERGAFEATINLSKTQGKVAEFVINSAYFAYRMMPTGPNDIKEETIWEERFDVEPAAAFFYEGDVVDAAIMGDIAYGYVGAEYYSEDFLYLAGGLIEALVHYPEYAPVAPFLPCYGEAPEDIVSEKKGIEINRNH